MEVVVHAVAGSHLFGLNTEKSDKDFKGVYLPTKREILLGNYRDVVSKKTNQTGKKNTSEDTDISFFSLRRFLSMLQEGQTVAIELLWTPPELIVASNSLWEIITSQRERFMHAGVTAFIGYARTQANKYGVKGSRMSAVKSTIDFLAKEYNGSANQKLSDIWESITAELSNVEHITIEPFLEVCGRKFQKEIKVGYTIEKLQEIYNNYGERAIQASKNENIDWKAVSHAFRVAKQAQEILSTGKLTLPLPQDVREITLAIKQGKLPFSEVSPLLDSNIEKMVELEKTSHLPKHPDVKFYEDILCTAHEIAIRFPVIGGSVV